VADLFPSQRSIYAHWRTTSLLGQRLDDPAGRPLGVIVVMLGPGTKDRAFAETLVRLYALRAVGELERRRHQADSLAAERHPAVSQAALLAQEAQFQDAFEHTDDAVFFLRVEAEGRFAIERVNSRLASAIGLPIESIVGRTPQDIYPPDVAARFLADYRE